MEVLAETDSLDLCENITIQTIIDFKWETYAYKFFLKRFKLYSAFLCIYIANIYFSVFRSEIEAAAFYILAVLRLVGLWILIIFLKYEIV
jgi:hypothetical protein